MSKAPSQTKKFPEIDNANGHKDIVSWNKESNDDSSTRQGLTKKASNRDMHKSNADIISWNKESQEDFSTRQGLTKKASNQDMQKSSVFEAVIDPQKDIAPKILKKGDIPANIRNMHSSTLDFGTMNPKQ